MSKECSVDGCDRQYYAKGLCRRCYYRKKRTGTTDAPVYQKDMVCKSANCTRQAYSRGYCDPCGRRHLRYNIVDVADRNIARRKIEELKEQREIERLESQ